MGTTNSTTTIVRYGDKNRVNSSNFDGRTKKFELPFSNVFRLSNCFLKVAVSFLCRLQAVSKIHVPIYSYLIVKGDEIVRPCDSTAMKTENHLSQYTTIR